MPRRASESQGGGAGWKRGPSLSRERPGDGARALPLPLLRFTHFVLVKKVDSK